MGTVGVEGTIGGGGVGGVMGTVGVEGIIGEEEAGLMGPILCLELREYEDCDLNRL